MTDIDGLTGYVYHAPGTHWARLDAVTYPAVPGGPPAATSDSCIETSVLANRGQLFPVG